MWISELMINPIENWVSDHICEDKEDFEVEK
jgi:hypothetical protein